MNKFRTLIVLILVSLGAWVGVTNYMTPEPAIAQAEVKPVEEEEIINLLPENPRKLYGGGGGGGFFVPHAPPPPPPSLPVFDPMITI
jgi:hypothetical protein